MKKESSKNNRRKFLKAMTGIGAGFFLSKLIPKASGYDRPTHDATEIKGKFNDITFEKKDAATIPIPEEGKIYYNSDNEKLKYHTNTVWKDVGSGEGIGKYTQTFASQTTIAVPHNLSDSNVIIQVIDENEENIIPMSIDRTDGNNAEIKFGGSQSGTVIIHGGEYVVPDNSIPAPGTQGRILYDNGTKWLALDPGTDGQVLKTQGAGKDPIWGNISSGSGLKKLAETSTEKSTSTNTYTEIGNCTIAPGAVSNHILVIAELVGHSTTTLNIFSSTAYARLKIGLTGNIDSIKDKMVCGIYAKNDKTTVNLSAYKTITFYYEPTIAEKTTGFNVKIYGKYSDNGVVPLVAKAKTTFESMIVLGC